MKKKAFILVIFFMVIVFELGLQTFWLESLNIYIRPIIYLSIAVSYLLFGYYFSKIDFHFSISTKRLRFDLKYLHIFTLIIIALILFYGWTDLNNIISNNEIKPTNSDVIPSVELYVKRLLNGDKVYSILHFPGWDVAPTYLTLMWSPYIIPEILGIDYRMFSFLLFISFVVFLYLNSFIHNPNQFATYFILIYASLMLSLLIKYDISVFAQTLELTVAVFYMILAFTILNKNTLLLALGILLCLLSRYSLSFWLVSYIMIIFVHRGWKDFTKVNLYIIAGILILFFPFIADNPKIFVQGFKHYNKAAIGEWQVHNWQNSNEEPYQLSRGFGFAIYFYKLAAGDTLQRLKILQKSHLIISFLSGLSIFFIYYFNRKIIKNLKLFLMFGLKFFIMVFLVFIQVPYSYLFIVPLFLIIPILYEMVAKKTSIA